MNTHTMWDMCVYDSTFDAKNSNRNKHILKFLCQHRAHSPSEKKATNCLCSIICIITGETKLILIKFEAKM